MIETQRAFQANAKGVTASDEMMADLVAMKR
jgi:flagellar hook protein FlgE